MYINPPRVLSGLFEPTSPSILLSILELQSSRSHWSRVESSDEETNRYEKGELFIYISTVVKLTRAHLITLLSPAGSRVLGKDFKL